MSSLTINDDLVKKLVRIVDDRWVSIDEIEHILGIKMSLDLLNKLGRTGLFEVMYSTLDGTFYIRRRVSKYTVENSNGGSGNGNGKGKLNLQRIVDKIRSEIRGMIPKPEFENWLSSNVAENWQLVYNQLLNDGVIEEVLVSGMVFIKVVNE